MKAYAIVFDCYCKRRLGSTSSVLRLVVVVTEMLDVDKELLINNLYIGTL